MQAISDYHDYENLEFQLALGTSGSQILLAWVSLQCSWQMTTCLISSSSGRRKRHLDDIFLKL